MTLQVNLGKNSYEILIERGGLARAGEYLDLQRKVLIVTDSGVPEKYAELLAAACREPVICRVPQGEENKNLAVYETLLRTMLDRHFTRKDCVAAVGGGICGDMAGFAAATYMRGIDFYNIPTTVLSQVDSSVGGKTAVNLGEIKNVVGAFYQPKRVLIDVDVLKTLPARHVSAGLAEALKMAVTFDEELFRLFEEFSFFEEFSCEEISVEEISVEEISVEEFSAEQGQVALPGDPDRIGKIIDDPDRIETIIERALRIKIAVVEQDEKEQGLRKALNFGHTIGHGIESLCLDGSLYHGECVTIGMLPMCSEEVRQRLLPVLKKLRLPTDCRLDPELVLAAMMHDKKAAEGKITTIETDRIGTFHMRSADRESLRPKVAMVTGKPAAGRGEGR